MHPVDSEPDRPLLDVGEFWREHDRALPQHKYFGNVTLSHDLYRGMPPWFNAYYAYFQRLAVLRLLDQCMLVPGIHALDIGCGTGRWSELMLSQGWKSYGIDVGKQALSYAAEA
jgi:2-polyprenyl-3-methyl-5-hydroxy-6-metoxy-1,4-benzoquinol methylase